MSDVLDLPLRSLFAEAPPRPATAGLGVPVPRLPQREFAAAGAPSTTESPARAPDAESLLHEAVFALAARELAGLIRALPLDRAAAALRDRDPVAAIGGLLADAAVTHAAVATDDPLGVALLRGARRKRELLAAAGGAWSTGTVAEHLGLTRQGVDKRRQAGTLLGVRLPSGDWVYPVSQFGPDGAPLPGLAEALGALGGITSGWMQLEHLLAPDPALGARAVGGATGERATKPASAASAAEDVVPRSALQALRADGARALPAVVAALRQAGDLDG